jgi:hypothetical protein
METFDGEMSAAARTRRRRQARKKNEAFRIRLEERKEARREVQRLKLATAAAAMSWVLVGLQLMR